MAERWSPVVPAVGSKGNDNIKLQSAAWGDQYKGHVRVNAAGENIQPAGLLSTAPYKDPNAPRPEIVVVQPERPKPEPEPVAVEVALPPKRKRTSQILPSLAELEGREE